MDQSHPTIASPKKERKKAQTLIKIYLAKKARNWKENPVDFWIDFEKYNGCCNC